jgi:hypothetical protein
MIHDQVVTVIPRPEMTEGPQHADAFLHVYFDEVRRAREGGRTLVRQTSCAAAFSVYRVRTVTVV